MTGSGARSSSCGSSSVVCFGSEPLGLFGFGGSGSVTGSGARSSSCGSSSVVCFGSEPLGFFGFGGSGSVTGSGLASFASDFASLGCSGFGVSFFGICLGIDSDCIRVISPR